MQFLKNKKIIFTILIIVLLVILFFRTGILQKSKIDFRDLERWDYDKEGIILGAERIVLEGKSNVCWYLIHGYTSTPDEMKKMAEEIYREFGETVIVERLKGHGEVPSHILDLTLDDWYEQVSKEFDILKSKCTEVNLVGFSFGGALSTRLAETKKVNNIYLLSPYIFTTYKYYHIFKFETYLDIFTEILNYSKKTKTGQINSQEDLNKHIAYWNMPFAPIKYSKSFLEDMKNNLNKIKNPILLQQSKNDKTSDIKSSFYIYENIESENKELITFEKSNHIIVEDYDKEAVIKNIIDFEKKTR